MSNLNDIVRVLNSSGYRRVDGPYDPPARGTYVALCVNGNTVVKCWGDPYDNRHEFRSEWEFDAVGDEISFKGGPSMNNCVVLCHTHGIQQAYDDIKMFHKKHDFVTEKSINDYKAHYPNFMTADDNEHGEHADALRFVGFMLKNMSSYVLEKCKRSFDSRLLRLSLILEEAGELSDSLETGTEADVLDAICDLTYVVIGTAVTYGLPFAAGFAEVQRSNMTKAIRNTNDVRLRDKGPDFVKPDMEKVLREYRNVQNS